jgi:phage repressor protein C with HTH and peptisase S24 domain
MLLSERIKLALDEAGLSQVDLARACGVKPPSVHGWLNGKAKFLRGENLLLAARALNVNQEWLATGAGPMHPGEQDQLKASHHGLAPGTFMRVDVVGPDDPRLTIIPKVRLRLTAGLSGFEVEPEPYDGSSTTVPTDWVERNGYSRDKLIAIRVRGESMEPTFYEDDLVVINTGDTQPVAGSVYAVNYEGEPAIKRLARDAGRWWLVSDNSDQRRYYRQSFQSDTTQIIGRVVRKETERF